MKKGDTITVIRDQDTRPSESRNTRLISAAIASGAVFASDSANPLFPASGLATGSLNGLNPKSNFLAIAKHACFLV
jgi:hypothetical protein